jgi:hypothetical protein
MSPEKKRKLKLTIKELRALTNKATYNVTHRGEDSLVQSIIDIQLKLNIFKSILNYGKEHSDTETENT